jgi:hypothetical protein
MRHRYPRPVDDRGTFDPAEFAKERPGAGQPELGTALWFENEHVRVLEVRLSRPTAASSSTIAGGAEHTCDSRSTRSVPYGSMA